MKTKSRSKTESIATSDTEVVKNNPDRVQLTIVNNGGNTIHIDISNEVTNSLGLRIAPSGTLSLNSMEDGDLVKRQWFGIAAGAASNVRVYEVIKIGEDES